MCILCDSSNTTFTQRPYDLSQIVIWPSFLRCSAGLGLTEDPVAATEVQRE
jgi:hypothetical protein